MRDAASAPGLLPDDQESAEAPMEAGGRSPLHAAHQHGGPRDMVLSVFITQGEGRSQDTTVDLLIV